MGKPLLVGAFVVLTLVACNNDKAQLEQQQHDQQIAAAAALNAAAAQSEKDKAAAAAAASEAAKQAAAIQEQKDTTARARAAAALRADVQQNPGKYLQVSAPSVARHGIINHTTSLSGLTVLNTSKFALTNLQGTVAWSDGSTTPFALSGSIPAGATLTFASANGTLTSGTAGGKVDVQQFSFAPATIVTP